MAERGSFIPVRATQATIGGAPFELGDNLPGTKCTYYSNWHGYRSISWQGYFYR